MATFGCESVFILSCTVSIAPIQWWWGWWTLWRKHKQLRQCWRERSRQGNTIGAIVPVLIYQNPEIRLHRTKRSAAPSHHGTVSKLAGDDTRLGWLPPTVWDSRFKFQGVYIFIMVKGERNVCTFIEGVVGGSRELDGCTVCLAQFGTVGKVFVGVA